jgi:hypothetical protein
MTAPETNEQPRKYFDDPTYDWKQKPPEWAKPVTDESIIDDIYRCYSHPSEDLTGAEWSRIQRRAFVASSAWTGIDYIKKSAHAKRLRAASPPDAAARTGAFIAPKKAKGYAGTDTINTDPKEWLYAVMPKGAIAYFNINDPYRAYPAKVMDERIPRHVWERIGHDEAEKKVKPSISHLSRAEFEIKKFADNPTMPATYRDIDGELVLNQWRPYVLPPRPPEDRFEIVKFVEDWLDLIYPGRKDFIIKSWAHAYQRPDEKQNVGFVWGGNQGIGKDTLLSTAFHVLARQNRVANIKHDQLGAAFEEFLLWPILIINEFHQIKGDDGLMINRLKAYCAAPPREFRINIKYQLLRLVYNNHSVHITTNMEDRFKRENGDRRYYVMKSHATKEQVRAFVGGRIGANTNLAAWIEDGRGDAFGHYLMSVDLSDFDASRLPEDVEDYDEVQKGFAIQPALAAALDEAAYTFGQSGVPPEQRKELEEMEMADWPEFISSQQLMHCAAYFNMDVDGKPVKAFISNHGWLNVEMNTAGYQELIREEGKTQWVSSKKPADAKGIRAQSSRLFIRKDRIVPGEKVNAMRVRASMFLNELTEYWSTTEGINNYRNASASWVEPTTPGFENAKK